MEWSDDDDIKLQGQSTQSSRQFYDIGLSDKAEQ